MKKFAWLSTALLSVNILTGLLLFLSLASIYIDPLDWWLPALAGLSFLQIFSINFFFFLFWLFFKKKYLPVSLIFLIFGLTELPNHFQINFPNTALKKSIKVMSLNVRNFDLYNWTENKKTRNKILYVIKAKNAEIFCLQEFFNTTNPEHDFKTLDTILQFDKKYESHVEYTATVKETEHWGIATFTSFPILNTGKVDFSEKSNNICIYTDVLIENDTFRVYNMHLASVKFAREDYTYLNEVADRSIDPNVENSVSLIKKLKNAYEKRSPQVKAVRSHMDQCPYPIILCGDFNDTPTSYTYNELVKGLKDTYREKGNGFGSTYNGKLPFLRIDYIFTDPGIHVLKHEVIRSDVSDHYPIWTSLEMPN